MPCSNFCLSPFNNVVPDPQQSWWGKGKQFNIMVYININLTIEGHLFTFTITIRLIINGHNFIASVEQNWGYPLLTSLVFIAHLQRTLFLFSNTWKNHPWKQYMYKSSHFSVPLYVFVGIFFCWNIFLLLILFWYFHQVPSSSWYQDWPCDMDWQSKWSPQRWACLDSGGE